jgi:hypothetical protein
LQVRLYLHARLFHHLRGEVVKAGVALLDGVDRQHGVGFDQFRVQPVGVQGFLFGGLADGFAGGFDCRARNPRSLWPALRAVWV